MTTALPTNIPQPRAAVVGLGNPGTDYSAHRHNIGFRVIDALARAHGLRFTRQKPIQSHLAAGPICGSHVILAKPRTYMNLSGRAVSRLSRQYEVDAGRILVVYDDLDLPLGRLRLRPGGGSGGHQGMRSIIKTLGTNDFPRLRVGIGRPPGGMDPAEYVLEPFDEAESVIVSEVVEMAVGAIESWIAAGIVVAMDQYNRPLLTEDQTGCSRRGAEPRPHVDRVPCPEISEASTLEERTGTCSEGSEG